MIDSIPNTPLEPPISIPSIPLEPPITIPSTPMNPAEENPWDYSVIPDFYDRVRASLNTDAVVVTNEVIDYFENAPRAEREMRKRVPIWRSLDEFKIQLFQTCIIYMTCYYLCPIVNAHGAMTEQTTPSLTLKYATPTVQEKPCERFLDLIDDLLVEILDEEREYFFGFKVTKEYPECSCKKVWNGWNKNAFNPIGNE